MINLYEYQKRYLADLPARAIMAADTGTGKTFMALAHYHTMMATPGKATPDTPLLILAPAAKVRTHDWEREIQEWFGDLAQYVTYEIYSYEKFSRKPSKNKLMTGSKPIWHQYSPKHGGIQAAVICDEVHRAKNPQSDTGKAVYEVTKNARFFVGLSATPLPNGWIDFANYAKIWGFTKNITSFKRDFCRYIDVGFPKLVGYRNEDILTKAWNSISKRLTKAEALDLPDRTFIGTDFTRPAEYTRIHKERKTTDGVWLDTAPALAHALRQSLTEPKLEYVSDLLEGTNENVVVFYNYVTEREALLKLLSAKKFKGKKIYRQDGEKHQLPKKADWPTIGNSITLAQYQSGSTGVEMTYATQVIYFSPTYSYSDYVQSIGRVYRNGQTNKTTFYNLRTPNTIEEAVYEALRGKQDFQVTQWLGEL
jgi:SNF2 family DNA or RNA helicase